ncbi:hypothetical protein [Actinomadura hibisca]|uniref:hypothetical protein n=1 Tax=Actinomadura hibisca TaxID=68565 RepID=UPI0008309C31|nr:hypothetical protein [Actinomadura hibisca]
MSWIYAVPPAALLLAALAVHWAEDGARVEHLATRLDDALDVHDGPSTPPGHQTSDERYQA